MDELSVRVTGGWKDLYRAVDKGGATVEFLLTVIRDCRAASRFLRKAIVHQSVPEKVTLDKSGATRAAIESYKADHDADIRPAPVSCDIAFTVIFSILMAG